MNEMSFRFEFVVISSLHTKRSHICASCAQGIWTIGGILAKLLELASVGCWVMVMGIVSNCINFTIFAFVMVSNAQKRCAIFGCYVDSSV